MPGHEQPGGWTEQPYFGALDNQWSRNGSWAMLRFDEDRAARPFHEDQFWEYVPATSTHRRTLLTNAGVWGVLTSKGPSGNVMSWEGPFGDDSDHLSETLTRISAEQYHWQGEITRGKDRRGFYQLMCHKQPSHE